MALGIKANLDDAIEKRFRERAMKKFGYRKGALTKALTEAIHLWLEREEETLPLIGNPTRTLKGLLKGVKESSVELQHLGSKLMHMD